MTDITTPVGRIVWGNPINGRGKTDNNNQPVIGQDGKQVTQWSFGLAIPKDQCGEIFAAMQSEAATIFAQGTPSNFAWKFKDGDGLDDKGQPFANREGYAGHFVLSISTEAFAPRVVRLVNGAYSDMLDGVKTGDYARVALAIKAHAGKMNVRGSVPGLYLNPTMVEFIGYGEEIRSGPDAMAVFGGAPVPLPPGASAAPVASGPMPGMVQQPGNPTLPGGGAQPVTQQSYNPVGTPGNGAPLPSTTGPNAPMPASPSNPPAPAHDFVQNATGGVMPGQPAPQPGNAPSAPGAAPVPGGAPMPGFPGQR